MRIKQLECFVDLARTTSLTKTAKNMRLAVPSLSETIDRMQSEIGADLFVKTSKGYFLNNKGEMFLRSAEKIVLDYQDAIHKISGYDIVDTIHFGIDPTIYPLLFSQLLAQHEQKYADETLELVRSDFYNFKEDLLKNKIDVCYSYQFSPFPKQFEFYPLFDNQLCALMNKNHPLFKKFILREEDLYDQTIYYDVSYTTSKIEELVKRLENNGATIKLFNSPEKPVSMLDVQHNNGIMILHQDKRDVYTADMRLTPINGLTEPFGLIYLADKANNYLNLIETMKQYF